MNPWRKIHTKMLMCPEYGELSESSRLAFYEFLLCSKDQSLPDEAALAWMTRKSTDEVKHAIYEIECVGWLERSGDGYAWTRWSDYQGTGKSSAERSAEHRRRKCNVPATSQQRPRNALEVEVEVEGEREAEQDKDKGTEDIVGLPASPPLPVQPKKKSQRDIHIERIFNLWQATWEHPRVKLTKAVRDIINKRLAEGFTFEELCCAVVGYKYDTWEVNGVLMRQDGGLGTQRIHLMLGVKARGGRDGAEVGMDLFRRNYDRAFDLLPPDVACRVAKSWGDVAETKYPYQLCGMNEEEMESVHERVLSGQTDKYQWRQWAYAVLVESLNGNRPEAMDGLKVGWLAGEEPPRADDKKLKTADREWLTNLGPIYEGVEA